MFLLISTFFAAIAAPLPAPTASASAHVCGRFMTGNWAGKGLVRGFGRPISVDNVATYAPDGSFKTRNRYLSDDRKWNEQSIAGTWTVTRGANRGRCRLVMTSASSGFEASSTSDIQMIDANTYRSIGFDMKRVLGKVAR